MTAIERIFGNMAVVREKLEPYGFASDGSGYTVTRTLSSSGFLLTVTVSESGEVTTKTVDPALGETYTLHLTDGATGSFVGRVRAEYEAALCDIAKNCFMPFVFKTEQAGRCIEYVRKTYGRELEFLWEKLPTAAIWRRADNEKWFGILMKVPACKVGLKGDAMTEVIDLRMTPEEKDDLIDGALFRPGYHMNKNSWFTVILDGSLDTDTILARIDKSYALANKK